MAGGATVGSSLHIRLDPHTLPARSSSQGEPAAAAFVIERNQALVSLPMDDGPARTMAVPLAAYRGVAVRMDAIGDNGDVRAFVELLHAESALTLLLASSDTPEDLAGDWQAWGRTLDLPLLVVGQDGSVSAPLLNRGATMAPPKPRRRHSYFAKRRPRFLTRRKTGRPDLMERLTGREIIARN